MTAKIAFAGFFAALSLASPACAQAQLPVELIDYNGAAPANSIVIDTSKRQLLFVNGDGTAIRYPVAVGRPGKQWAGEAFVASKHLKPAWAPPAEIKADNPALPDVIPSGAPNNPMGAAAIVLDRGEYAIHGTNRPDSIGTFASYGCIRMYNEDILDLFQRVSVGTQVMVLNSARAQPKPAVKRQGPRAQPATAPQAKPAKPQQAQTREQNTAMHAPLDLRLGTQ